MRGFKSLSRKQRTHLNGLNTELLGDRSLNAWCSALFGNANHTPLAAELHDTLVVFRRVPLLLTLPVAIEKELFAELHEPLCIDGLLLGSPQRFFLAQLVD